MTSYNSINTVIIPSLGKLDFLLNGLTTLIVSLRLVIGNAMIIDNRLGEMLFQRLRQFPLSELTYS